MALSKQSIRQGVHVLVDGVHATKEELITLSETWTEKKEVFFRKMLQQGGTITIQGKKFQILKDLKDYARNSKGEYEAPAKPHRNEDWE